eukprot:6585172-Prymnesium_polylepis.2
MIAAPQSCSHERWLRWLVASTSVRSPRAARLLFSRWKVPTSERDFGSVQGSRVQGLIEAGQDPGSRVLRLAKTL